MDVCTEEAVIDKVLCVGFLFQLLLQRSNMGLRARLEAMESHSTRKWKRQRSGLASLFSPDDRVPSDGCSSILEENFRNQKDSLIRFVLRDSLHRKFPLQEASAYDPLGIAHRRPYLQDDARPSLPESQLNNEHGSRRNFPEFQQEASTSADIHPSSKHLPMAAVAVAHMQNQCYSAATDEPHSFSSELSAHRSPSNLTVSSSDHQICRRSMPVSSGAPSQVSHMGSVLTRTGPAAVPVVEKPRLEPLYKQLLERISKTRDIRTKELSSEIESVEVLWENLQRSKQTVLSMKRRDILQAPIPAELAPLSEEEEEEVRQALNGSNRSELLVQHEPSNIDLSRAALQCLKPGAWLNDEVINLYMELLKERERREQKNYLKCHFFNTFFFNKLFKDARSYDYKAVRRWTTSRKLGYSLLECDKIFVPIHKDIHWCLAVINLREKKLQYLDSLKGQDMNALRALARYISDEAKDKGAENIDTSTWELNCLKDIPEQMNGCDCGMFMIKYADFLSRGDELKFTQEHMEYFRKRTILELLQLKAR